MTHHDQFPGSEPHPRADEIAEIYRQGERAMAPFVDWLLHPQQASEAGDPLHDQVETAFTDSLDVDPEAVVKGAIADDFIDRVDRVHDILGGDGRVDPYGNAVYQNLGDDGVHYTHKYGTTGSFDPITGHFSERTRYKGAELLPGSEALRRMDAAHRHDLISGAEAFLDHQQPKDGQENDPDNNIDK